MEGHQIAQQPTLRHFRKVQVLRVVVLHLWHHINDKERWDSYAVRGVASCISSIGLLYYIYRARERKHKHNGENAPCEVVSCANNSNVPKRRKCTMNRLEGHRLIGSSPSPDRCRRFAAGSAVPPCAHHFQAQHQIRSIFAHHLVQPQAHLQDCHTGSSNLERSKLSIAGRQT